MEDRLLVNINAFSRLIFILTGSNMLVRSSSIHCSISVLRSSMEQVIVEYLKIFKVHFLAASRPIHQAVTLALVCHSIHYAKRLYETQFVHRFSNGTMPIRNLFKVAFTYLICIILFLELHLLLGILRFHCVLC
jgi:hypothetical protein